MGADLWDKAHEVVLNRFREEGLLVDALDPNGEGQANLFTVGDVKYTKVAPIRTDVVEDNTPPKLRNLYYQGPKQPWEKLSNSEIRNHLQIAQTLKNKLVGCAGCGRELEPEFMELDHIIPRSDGGSNNITNRILLCKPCNQRKSNQLTMSGLIRQNKKTWMRDESIAKLLQTT